MRTKSYLEAILLAKMTIAEVISKLYYFGAHFISIVSGCCKDALITLKTLFPDSHFRDHFEWDEKKDEGGRKKRDS